MGEQSSGRLRVALGARSYDVLLARGWRGLTPAVRRLATGPRALLVTDDHVGPLYAGAVRAALAAAGLRTATARLRAGEARKTLPHAARLYERALDCGLDRGDLIVALGGGVVGDMAGFAAATYLRGVALIQLPTTLLAMVDAAVGGKTGVNLSRGKNLVGAFHQPRLVYANLATLATLSRRQLRAGLAEVIKCGMIRDARLFRHLETRLAAVLALEPAPLASAVLGAVRVKARIVAADEREGGVRALLNYGHTVGHAIETVTRYRRYLHGEAVAIGMQAAARLAVELGVASPSTAARQERLLAAAGLPRVAPALPVAAILAALRRDKKVQAGTLRFVLTSKVGSASVHRQPSATALRRSIASITNT